MNNLVCVHVDVHVHTHIASSWRGLGLERLQLRTRVRSCFFPCTCMYISDSMSMEDRSCLGYKYRTIYFAKKMSLTLLIKRMLEPGLMTLGSGNSPANLAGRWKPCISLGYGHYVHEQANSKRRDHYVDVTDRLETAKDYGLSKKLLCR